MEKVTKSSSIGEKSVLKSRRTKSFAGRVFETFRKNMRKIGKR